MKMLSYLSKLISRFFIQVRYEIDHLLTLAMETKRLIAEVLSDIILCMVLQHSLMETIPVTFNS